MRKSLLFSLVEMIVVFMLIAVLASLISPTLKKLIKNSTRVKELNDQKSLNIATLIYAEDYNGFLPDRGRTGMLHNISPGSIQHNLNRHFIEPYLGEGEDTRNKYLFCQSTLLEKRNSSIPMYKNAHGTLAYYNISRDSFGLWRSDAFYLNQIYSVQGLYPVWSCIMLKSDQLWFGHDAPVSYQLPEGGNTVWSDGSGGWVDANNWTYIWWVNPKYRFFAPTPNTSSITNLQYPFPGP